MDRVHLTQFRNTTPFNPDDYTVVSRERPGQMQRGNKGESESVGSLPGDTPKKRGKRLVRVGTVLKDIKCH